MQALLIAIGSRGDIYPFVGLGRSLASRGMTVHLASDASYAGLAEAEGLEFSPLYELEGHPASGARRLRAQMQLLRRLIEPAFSLIERRSAAGPIVVVAQPWAFGARIAQEALGVPLATLHIEPFSLRGRGRPAGVRWPPRRLEAAIDWLADRRLGPAIEAVRRRFDLPPVSGIIRDWWNSPQSVLALFPEWFSWKSLEWPPNTRFLGFWEYEPAGRATIPPEADAFLAAGEAPIVVSHASSVRDVRRYLSACCAAAARLGRRAVFVTPHRDRLPERLPADALHLDYYPFAIGLPRACLHVHNGGIGTVVQTLRAGIPQLVAPRVWDQFFNARRLLELGVSATLKPWQVRTGRVVAQIERLLGSAGASDAAGQLAPGMVGTDALGAAGDALEALARSFHHGSSRAAGGGWRGGQRLTPTLARRGDR